MHKLQPILEKYLNEKFSDRTPLSVTRLEKLADGWESDNYRLSVEYGAPVQRADWVWRIYSGSGSGNKATHEFGALQQLHLAGYPVPQVYQVETEGSPVQRPFILEEFIPGENMGETLLGAAPQERKIQLLEQFCALFVQLHRLDWRLFDDSLPGDDPYFIIDRLLASARRDLEADPSSGAGPVLDWISARREAYACPRLAPVHQDFHPSNVLVRPDQSAAVIDWTNFEVSDPRFDLAWTLVLVYSYAGRELRDYILQGYQRHAGQPIQNIEVFEVIACARRLLDLAVSLTQGSEQRGMNPQAVEAMRASMDANRRVYQLFIEITGLRVHAFDQLFG